MTITFDEKDLISLESLINEFKNKSNDQLFESFSLKLNCVESSCSEIQFADLPSRIEKQYLIQFFQVFNKLSAEGAEWSFQVPHPHHDFFLSDLGYVSALLPETFLSLKNKGLNFEMQETAFILDPEWQKSIDAKEITYDDIKDISKQALNVIQQFQMKLKIKKSAWSEAPMTESFVSSVMTPEVLQQLNDQLKSAVDRGDLKTAEVIKSFINKK